MKDLGNKKDPFSLILNVKCPRDSIVAGGFVAVNNNATLVITHTTAVTN